jgi:hypothetical protein
MPFRILPAGEDARFRILEIGDIGRRNLANTISIDLHQLFLTGSIERGRGCLRE